MLTTTAPHPTRSRLGSGSGSGLVGWGPRVASAWPCVAAERTSPYRASERGQLSMATLGAGRPAASTLDRLVSKVEEADRLLAEASVLAAELRTSGEAEQVTGVPVDLWLAADARSCRADRRALDTVARVLARMPALRGALADGTVSYSQVRQVTYHLRHHAEGLLHAVDNALAELLDEQTGWDPDQLTAKARWLADAVRPEILEADDRDAQDGRFLVIQPQLDAQRGRIYGELDTAALTLIDDTLHRIADAIDTADLPGPTRALLGAPAQPTADDRRRRSRRLADALVALAAGIRPDIADSDASAAAGTPAGAGGGTVSRPGGRGHADQSGPGFRPTLLLTMSLDSLLGRDGTPAEIITRFTGGRLKVASGTARDLIAAGADVRGIVLDDTGHALGVGRRTRIPPDWLKDALTALWPTSVAPLADTSSRHADLDHHLPWAAGGRTDLDNLAPLARTDHRLKDGSGWQLTVDPDTGGRVWIHPRTGLRLSVPPATRRPKPPRLADLPPPHARARPDPPRDERPPPPTHPPPDDGWPPPDDWPAPGYPPDLD